jgi:hypothetical protein
MGLGLPKDCSVISQNHREIGEIGLDLPKIGSLISLTSL